MGVGNLLRGAGFRQARECDKVEGEALLGTARV